MCASETKEVTENACGVCVVWSGAFGVPFRAGVSRHLPKLFPYRRTGIPEGEGGEERETASRGAAAIAGPDAAVARVPQRRTDLKVRGPRQLYCEPARPTGSRP